MSTLIDIAKSEADAYADLAASQQTVLQQATLELASAQADAQWAAARSAQLSASEAAARRALESAPLPSDAAAAALELEDTLVSAHDALAIALASADRLAQAQAAVAQAQQLLGWATGRRASADAAVSLATARDERIATQTAQLAAPPLSTAKADATAALGSTTTDAEASLEAMIPDDDLRDRALARAAAVREGAVADAAAVATAEDLLAAAEAASGAEGAAVAEERLASARADDAYTALLLVASEVARATGLLDAIAAAPPLTQAEQDRFDALAADGQAALTALGARDAADDELAAKTAAWEEARATALVDHPEDDPDTVQAVIDALADIPNDDEAAVQQARIEVISNEAAWATARAAALAADPDADPDLDPAVDAAKDALDASKAALTAAETASDMSADERADAGAWTAALPDRAWRAAVDLDDAKATLTAIAAISPASSLTALRAAESDLADATQDQGQKERAARQLAAFVSAVRSRTSARSTTQTTRLLSATRGDG